MIHDNIIAINCLKMIFAYKLELTEFLLPVDVKLASIGTSEMVSLAATVAFEKRFHLRI